MSDPPAFVIETMPKVGFRLIAGPPDASPAAEPSAAIAPSPSAPLPSAPAPAAPPPSVAPQSPWTTRLRWAARRRILVAAALLLAIAAGLWIAARQTPDRFDAHVIEVLPFRPLRESPDVSALATRAGDAMVRYMTTAGVSSRTTLAANDANDAVASAPLRVAATVDIADDEVVLSGQIVDRETGIVLFAYALSRPLAQRAGIDEQFAAALAATIVCAENNRRNARVTIDAATFGLLLQVCGSLVVNDGDAPTLALGLAQRAPNLAQAQALVATTHVGFLHRARSEEERARWIAVAKAAAERALALDRRSAAVWVAQAQLAQVRMDWVQREAALMNALELDPTLSPAIFGELSFLREVGRLREAQALSRSLENVNDPRLIGAMPHVAFLNAMLADPRGVRAAMNRLMVMFPHEEGSTRWTIAMWWDPSTRAADVRRLAPADMKPDSLRCSEAYFARLEAARGAPQRGLPEPCAGHPVDWRIRMLARQGDLDGAFALAKAEVVPLDRRPPMFLFYPEMKAFQSDPRFMPLADAWGLLDYWRRTGRWPDFCEDPDLPYECRAFAN